MLIVFWVSSVIIIGRFAFRKWLALFLFCGWTSIHTHKIWASGKQISKMWVRVSGRDLVTLLMVLFGSVQIIKISFVIISFKCFACDVRCCEIEVETIGRGCQSDKTTARWFMFMDLFQVAEIVYVGVVVVVVFVW